MLSVIHSSTLNDQEMHIFLDDDLGGRLRRKLRFTRRLQRVREKPNKCTRQTTIHTHTAYTSTLLDHNTQLICGLAQAVPPVIYITNHFLNPGHNLTNLLSARAPRQRRRHPCPHSQRHELDLGRQGQHSWRRVASRPRIIRCCGVSVLWQW